MWSFSNMRFHNCDSEGAGQRAEGRGHAPGVRKLSRLRISSKTVTLSFYRKPIKKPENYSRCEDKYAFNVFALVTRANAMSSRLSTLCRLVDTIWRHRILR